MKYATIILASLLSLATGANAATHTETTTAPRLPFLRGMGFDGYYENRNRTWMTQPGVYSGLVAKGFDHVRLPVDFRTYATYDSSTGIATLKETTSSGWSSGPGFSTFDTVISNAINAGLYITLDFHGWFDIDVTNATQRAQFKAYWKAVAERYKDYPNKLIFELANEPRAPVGQSAKLNSLQKETVEIIRQTNPTRLILYAVPDANQPWALTQAANPPKDGWVSYPANDNNLALVIHCYNPGEFTHQGETWANPSYTSQVRLTDSHRTTLRWDLNQLTLYKKDHDIPIVMNEYNVSHKLADHGDVTEYLSIVTRYCESNGIPWSPWIYYSSSGGGMDCFSGYGANASMFDYVEAGLFPDLKTTDKFSTNDYPHAVDITFSGYEGASALANFPVLVKLSESGIYGFHYSDFTTTNGFDLCFTDASGNLLAHEIDTWNPNGVSTVWVKVPSLTASTKIVARYGCAKPIVPKVESVWDADYVGVWHMGERALPLADSTGVSRDVTSADGTGIGYGSTGIVGGAVDFGATGGSRCVNTDDHAALDGFQQMTIEAWTYQTSRPASGDKNTGILGKRTSSSSEASYYLYDSGADQKSAFYVASSGSSPQSAGKLVPTELNAWNHQVHTFDGSVATQNAKGYLNGALQSSATANVSQIFAGAAELHIGNFQSGDSRNFPGKIDEVRISKCVRSADWIQASYDTVAKANFATYAVEGVETPPSPQTVVYGPLATNEYAKTMSIRFNLVQNGAVLTNFPVLVKLSTDIENFSYSDFNQENGGDIRFADPNGNLIPHEIDTWDTNGVSTVWVKVPRLTKNTIISAHYGCTGTPATVDPKDVWDDDYVGVWHLGESALPMKESSETSSNFETSFGDTIGYAAQGIVGGSVDFPTNGTYNALVAPDHDALDGFNAFTLEAWTYQNEHKNNAGILAKRKEYNNECAYYIYDVISESSGYVPFCIGTNRTAGARWSFNQTQPMGQWNHIVFSADMTNTTKNVHGYMNGTMNSWEPNVQFLGLMGNCACDLYLGNLGANKKDYTFNGRIDEVRISKVARSSAWVKATYDTIASGAFATYAVGTELEPDVNITNVLLKARTDKDNPIDYAEGDDIEFTFWIDGVEALPAEIRAKQPTYVIWTRTADDGITVKGTNAISLAESCCVTTRLATAGIVRMQGTLVGNDYKAFEYYDASNNKKNITFGGGAGVATEKMQLSTVEPADFDQFWAEAKAKLATVPFNDQNVELVDVTPSNLANSYTIYAAKIPCFGPRPVTGWLTVPKNPQAGGVPIQANFDGYGCISAAPKVPTYGAGQKVSFAVNAHGYDMTGHDDQYYKDFNDYINKTNRTFNGKTYGYAVAPEDYDNPTNTYFYYMALRVVRAFEYLKTRPEWNGRDVIASGGSQGGLQTMWAGGLVEGITEIKPSITWGCDIGCPWNGQGPYPSRTWGIPSVPGAYYFDSALHAKRVPRDCVANITRLGMGDYTCPPRGVLLSYYNMKCAVSAYLVQGSDHGYTPPQPNQTFTISKAAQPDDPPEPPAPQAVATDEAGYDYTNRVVTVTGATADESLTLTLTSPDGTAVGTVTATADAEGVATFDVATAPGSNYVYSVSQGDATIASGSFHAGGWNADGAWFLTVPDGQGGSTEVNGSWTTPPTATNATSYTVGESAVFALSSDALAAGSEKLVRVETGIVYATLLEDGADPETNFLPDSIAAIVPMAAPAGGGTAKWAVHAGGEWMVLSGAIEPVIDTPYVVRFEGDFTLAAPRIRFSVSADGGATFATLSDANGVEWLVPTDAGKTELSEVVVDGSGEIAGISGELANADVAMADGTGYASLEEALANGGQVTLLTNSTWPTNAPVGTVAVDRGGYSILLPPDGVDVQGNTVIVRAGLSTIANEGSLYVTFDDLADLGIATAGRSPAQIAADLCANGANGIPKWQSYVLGLDITDATALPLANIALGTEDDTLSLSLEGVEVNPSVRASVSYQVFEAKDLSDPSQDVAIGDPAPGVPISVEMDGSGSQLFRLKVIIDLN